MKITFLPWAGASKAKLGFAGDQRKQIHGELEEMLRADRNPLLASNTKRIRTDSIVHHPSLSGELAESQQD